MDDFGMGYALGASENNNGGGRCNDGMFGDGNGWLGLIVILALFSGGWGGFGGFGGFGGGMGGAYPTEAILQRSLDTQTIIGKLDGVTQGLCDGFYAQNSAINGLGISMMQGFHGVDNAVCNLGYQTQQGFNATQVAMMQGQNALSTQLAQCCCDNRAALADLKYDMATSDCSIKTLINQLVQQVMWGQQTGLRDLTDLINNKFCQLEMSQKDAVIADLRTQLAQCGDQNMANSIVARLTSVINPPAVPSYPAANPNGCGSWPASFLNCNANNWNGCGCGNGMCA